MLCKVIEPGGSECIQPLDFTGGLAVKPLLASQEPARPAPNEAGDSNARLAEVERRWEARAKERYQAGYNEGLSAGKQQNAAAVQAVMEKLAARIEELGGMRARLRQSAEEDLIRLAVAIARRVLRREVCLDPETIAALARYALGRLNGRDVSRVRTHPEHAAALRQILTSRQAVSLEIQADASLPPGSVVFETPLGTLDASVDTQLDEIERGLADRLGGRR